MGGALMCACSRISLADRTPAILVVATEKAGPRLAAGRAGAASAGRLRRAGRAVSVRRLAAARDAGGAGNGSAAPPRSPRSAPTPLAATALAAGRAEGDNAAGRISLERLGAEASTVLLARFCRRAAADAPPPNRRPSSRRAAEAAAPAAARDAAAPTEPAAPSRRKPSRSNRPCQRRAERRQPLRFVWQMDDDSRFTLDSDEFKALIGPHTAAALGQPWSEIAAALGLDPEGQVARAFASHDTWSGITVAFPVDGTDARLTVELSGLPVFDRDRNFRGYRGFGVCRDVARINELTQARRAARPPLRASSRRCSARSARRSPRCRRR